MNIFRTPVAKTIFEHKYKHTNAETWEELAHTLANDVCGNILSETDIQKITDIIKNMEFIPGGRYLYYAGRPNKFFNNCFIFKSESDTREAWTDLTQKATSALMSGGGIGNDYSIIRPRGSKISKTGGLASGTVSLMKIINEIGREVMQGGSRRSAIYASLNWKHGDVEEFLHAKDWYNMPVKGTNESVGSLKEKDFNYPAPLDMTNISLNYDDEFLKELHNGILPTTFIRNVNQALKTGEPGFSFNFGEKQNETGRNACTEVVSSDDSDVCNLGSINMSRIDTIEKFEEVVKFGTMFLLCGTLKADLPFEKVALVREKNRRLGLGLMGVHEWLLKRNSRYEVTPELHKWLEIYKNVSTETGTSLATKLNISVPVAFRAIAPTGSIGMLASTTTGIEPLYAVAYKRRYLKNGNEWHYQYVIDGTAKTLIDQYHLNPYTIESAIDLASDYERRIKFQADVQDYVDMSISSTINLPAWGSELNNNKTVIPFAETLAKYAPRLRGFTCYPDGARGGQPLTSVHYHEALGQLGIEFKEHDVCDITNRGGTCGS